MVANKVIISCAVTGAVHTPSLSDALPYTPEAIAEQAVAAAEAGAAILHVHARDPNDGSPTGDPDIFARFLPVIHERTDAVVNITTGGATRMEPEERLAAALRFKPELCSMNMGSINFAFHLMGAKRETWKFPWEKPYIEASEGAIFRNTFADIRRVIDLLADSGARYEHECYDLGHLYNLAFFLDRGILKPPVFIQSVFGVLGGIGVHPEDVIAMRRTADRLFGGDYVWSCLAAGKHQMQVLSQAALMGGHVRVGLEDSLYIGRGKLAASNAEQVTKIRTILAEFGLEPATPNEARALLHLKGRQDLAF